MQGNYIAQLITMTEKNMNSEQDKASTSIGTTITVQTQEALEKALLQRRKNEDELVSVIDMHLNQLRDIRIAIKGLEAGIKELFGAAETMPVPTTVSTRQKDPEPEDASPATGRTSGSMMRPRGTTAG